MTTYDDRKVQHYYERNIVDIKNEYTDSLINIMAPLMYETIKNYYDKAKKIEEMQKKNAIEDPNQVVMSVLGIFQKILKGVLTLTITEIENEYIRIRDASRHSDIFERLCRAVFKSFIVLLTFNASGKKCKLVNERVHETIDLKLFIHKCYIECAKHFFNYPELFWDEYPSIQKLRNQHDSIEIIKKSIVEGIKKCLPMGQILDEYLKNDYVVENSDSESKFMKIKNMLDNNESENTDNSNKFEEMPRVFESTDKDKDKDEENDIDKLENTVNDLSKLINDRARVTTDDTVASSRLPDNQQNVIQSDKKTTDKKTTENKITEKQNNKEAEKTDKSKITTEEAKRKINDGEYVNGFNLKTAKTKKPENNIIIKEKEKVGGMTADEKNAFFGSLFDK